MERKKKSIGLVVVDELRSQDKLFLCNLYYTDNMYNVSVSNCKNVL